MAADNEWEALYSQHQSLSQGDEADVDSACCARSDSGSELSEHSSESAKFTAPWKILAATVMRVTQCAFKGALQ